MGEKMKEYRKVLEAIRRKYRLDGSKSSGNYGHAGRPGKVGGSAPRFGGVSVKNFVGALKTVQEKVKRAHPEAAWRVAVPSEEEFKEYHKDAKCHVTKGGSTVAVTQDGDIVSVCRDTDDTLRGRDLIKMAVENGGTKLDSYEGNHDFYIKCGFEPVSWCKWDEQYAPEGWRKGVDKPEDIIFYRFTGKTSKYATASDFKSAVAASKDYDEAMKKRDDEI